MHVESFSVGPLGCNCSIIADLDAKRAIVIDPGGDLTKIRARLDALGLGVDAIVHTHTHIDHVGCTAELQRATGAEASIHEADRFLYDLLPVQAALIGAPLPEKAVELEGTLRDGRVLRAGSLEVGVIHTPGHTPGSVCFVARDTSGATRVFAGDTLFQGSIGRTDLWGGDHDTILKSIRGKLLSMPDDVVVVTGHGPDTTIGSERAHNPFLQR
jgi:glyoxylase-like metal-dependent hydrolase (beta-lactamase superfamily II)